MRWCCLYGKIILSSDKHLTTAYKAEPPLKGKPYSDSSLRIRYIQNDEKRNKKNHTALLPSPTLSFWSEAIESRLAFWSEAREPLAVVVGKK